MNSIASIHLLGTSISSEIENHKIVSDLVYMYFNVEKIFTKYQDCQGKAMDNVSRKEISDTTNCRNRTIMTHDIQALNVQVYLV